MTLKLAIIADDLTGALDSSVPFVLAGLSVGVAVTPAGLAAALAGGADVVAVNTASRALAPERAGEVVAAVARQVRDAEPQVVFKKIDSRLKGNVGVETAQVAAAMGLERVVVAPAVPDQQRLVRNGHVEGRGVTKPLAVAGYFAGLAQAVAVVDSLEQGDLDRLAGATDWSGQLAVGARGLGLGLARHLGAEGIAVPFERSARTLFAFGSRDPITETQMDVLVAAGGVAQVVEAPLGAIDNPGPLQLPVLLRCSGAVGADAAAVAERFAAGVALAIETARPEIVIMGGGDTALAILAQLGVDVVAPRGEIEPGVPWFAVTLAGGEGLVCAVKSGGFGVPDSLLKLTAPQRAGDAGRRIEENYRVQR